MTEKYSEKYDSEQLFFRVKYFYRPALGQLNRLFQENILTDFCLLQSE